MTSKLFLVHLPPCLFCTTTPHSSFRLRKSSEPASPCNPCNSCNSSVAVPPRWAPCVPWWLILLATLTSVAPLAAASSLSSWGAGQSSPPAGLNDVTAISSSADHSLALRANGTVVAWGWDFDGQCDVPAVLTNATAVAAGEFFSLALKSDGTVVAWGDNQYDQCVIPTNLANVVTISAGRGHGLALKSDGTVAAWGSDTYGQCSVPSGLQNVVAIDATWNYSLALKSDGTVVAWGVNDAGQTDVPAGLNNVVAISANRDYCLALKADGTLVSWGLSPSVPALGTLTAIAAGLDHCLALRSDGSVVAWGANDTGQTDVPALPANVTVLAAGWNYSLSLAGGSATLQPFLLTNPTFSSNGFSVSVPTQLGKIYTLQYTTSLSAPTWNSLPPVNGSGSLMPLADPSPLDPSRFYRVQAR